MIDPQAYRIQVGMFCIRVSSKLKVVSCLQHDMNALGLALILTLLVIGGVEQNPGPTTGEEHLPGPSFSGVTLMDVMEAIRITQYQIDGLTNKVHELTSIITDTRHNGKAKQSHQIIHPTPSDRLQDRQKTVTSNITMSKTLPDSPSPVSPRNSDTGVWTAVASSKKRRRSRSGTTQNVGAVMLGCQNVRRIATAAREEFLLGGHVVFKSIRGGTARSVLGALHGAVAGCKALKADLVLHVGGNDLFAHSVEYTLDCMSELIKAAKQINKVREIVVCSVPQDSSTSVNFQSMKRGDLNDDIGRLCKTEGVRFVDLRPRLDQCNYQGLDKSRFNLNRDGSRNAWQMLSSKVVFF